MEPLCQQEWKEGVQAVPSALGTTLVVKRSAPLMQHFCASIVAFLRSWHRSHFNELWAERRETRRQSLLFSALSPRLPLCFSYWINKTNKVNKQRMQSLVKANQSSGRKRAGCWEDTQTSNHPCSALLSAALAARRHRR